MLNDDIPLVLEREAGLADHYPQVAVGFGLLPVEDKKKSESAGHPVYVDKEFVKIVVPGDKQTVLCQPATDQHKQRFPKAYAAFKNRESKVVEGFPIEQWPQVTRATAMTLKAIHIHTVESLAEVSDSNLGNLGQQGRDLRVKAQAFVRQAKDSAAANALAVENQSLRDQMSAMQETFSTQLAELEKRLPKKAKAA
jgi:hypothetical protein